MRSCGRCGPATLGTIELEVQVEHRVVDRIRRFVRAEQPLLLAVPFDEVDGFRCATGHAQVAQRFVIDREEAGRGAVFGRHVGDGGPIGQRQSGQTGAEELDEATDHAERAQHLRDAQDKVGGGRALLNWPDNLTPTTSGINW